MERVVWVYDGMISHLGLGAEHETWQNESLRLDGGILDEQVPLIRSWSITENFKRCMQKRI